MILPMPPPLCEYEFEMELDTEVYLIYSLRTVYGFLNVFMYFCCEIGPRNHLHRTVPKPVELVQWLS